MIRGVDVSSNQEPKLVPWKQLREGRGIEFAFVRSSHGLGRDYSMLEHVRRARDAGVEVLVLYHAFYPRRDVRAQVELVMNALHAVGGDVAAAPDVEVMNDRSPSEVADLALEFFDTLEAETNRRCLAYTYPFFALGLPLDPSFALRPLWIAHYKTKAPLVPRPWNDWLIWQHDGDGGEVAPNGLDLDFNACRLSLPELREKLLLPIRTPCPG